MAAAARWSCWGVGIVAVCVSACDAPYQPPDVEIPPFSACAFGAADAADLIEVVPGGFESGGRAFSPHGIGSYPLLQHVGEGRLDAVRDVFAQARALGRPLLRTGAFMEGGNNPARMRSDDGRIREEGLRALDTLLAEAQAADVRLLLVLTNNWSDYGGAPFMVDTFAKGEPKDAFWSDPRVVQPHLEFVRRLATRVNTVTGEAYAADRSVFAWELANEARCTTEGYCQADTLVRWARLSAAVLREARVDQPIAWGGGGFLGRHGEDLRAIALDGAVDILTMHIYPQLEKPVLASLPRELRVESAIGEGAARIEEGAALAKQTGLPLLLEEMGYRPGEGADPDVERAMVFRGWLSVAHQRGLTTWPWMIGERGRRDFDSFLIRPQDEATWSTLTCE